jgi:excinuclease ABC subunit A
MAQSDIVIRGAREHNLRDVNLRLPRNKLICMTGVSGSGKSSLAFDTLYAEGQRRYVESLSSYARQFLGQMPKPDVDAVSGLAPSISIQQKMRGRNPRSTVGTITEIYDYLRVLFARVGQGQCERCKKPIAAQSSDQIIEGIARLPEKTRFQILAPVVQGQKGEYRDLFDDLLKQGFLRARVDGAVVELTDNLQLDRQMRHNIEVVVDRLIAGKTNRSRLAEAVEAALKLSGGTLIVSQEGTATSPDTPQSEIGAAATVGHPQSTDRLYSSHYACTDCGISYETPSPQLFSFNSPQGMCLDCTGLGMMHTFVIERLIPNTKQTIQKGAIELLGPVRKVGRWRRHILQAAADAIEDDLDLPSGSLLKTAWHDLPDEAQRLFLYGMDDRHITFSWGYSGGIWKHGGHWNGIIPDLLDDYRKTGSPMRRRQLEKYMEFADCASCGGARLNAQACNVRLTSASLSRDREGALPAVVAVQGSVLSLPEFCALPISDAAVFLEHLELDDTAQFIAGEAIKEIRGRLGFLLRCGLDYLSLDRTAPTLSGGESQRIRLAGQIGCGLVGVVYILDEPSIGLHSRDNQMLLDSLCDLRDQGNTVIVVEHDEETMRAADHIVDFGPGPGVRGGEVVVEGSLSKVLKHKRSITGGYLSGRLSIPIPTERRKPSKQKLTVVGARRNNLKNIDVTLPLGTFICITGVSGSGKSSLINDILWPVLNRELNGGKGSPGQHKRMNGLQYLDKAIDINQSPIGRTPRSNPATYVKVFDHIRHLFTMLPESKLRGYKPGRFSFNVDGGRCEACEGYGSNKLEMDFLADIWVTCPVCGGHRFSRETLEVRYKNASIADVLEMDVQEALEHFGNVPKIQKLVKALHDVGLDYIKLGQPSPTLSGGEAQRIKLARELGKRSTGKTIYILDEPTTGLHFADISKLLEVLHGFVDDGNTVLVVEHNLDVIKTADWVIDLGPEGGAGGGEIVAAGPPEEIAANPDSYTGRALAPLFGTSTSKNGRKKSPFSRDRAPTAGRSGSANARRNGTGDIVVRGAAQHNLQHIDINIPRNKISVFCGPSGSGKSSLAMDTLYAEGQRRYVESLSAYARQFLGQMPKPRVEHIHGLSPAIAIEQKSTSTTPRSTVGTVTEIYDYLRILFARLGKRYCPDCHLPIETQTTDQVIDKILAQPAGTKLLLLAPQEVEVGQKYERLWERLKSDGFLRVRVNGIVCRLEDVPQMDRRRKHSVEVVIDRITVNRRSRSRIADSVEAALTLGHGVMFVTHCDDSRPEEEWHVDHFSLHFACRQCHRSFEELTPNHFSFNSPLGWCESCEGLGTEYGTNLSSLISHDRATLLDGAVAAWPSVADSPLFSRMLHSMADQFGIPLDVPFNQLDSVHRRMVLYGTGERWIKLESRVESGESRDTTVKDQAPASKSGSRPSTLDSRLSFQYKGLYPAIDEASRVSYVHRRQLFELVGETACSTCDGSRLRDDAGAVRFRGKTLAQVCDLPLDDALTFLKSIRLKGDDRKVAGDLLTETTSRLSFLVEVGLHYLSLSRTLPSLSGGESQRIRLAGQIGRALTGVLYVLDEPTIGLHPRDNGRLLAALKKLRDLGNTLVLVEHDREVLNAADQLFDFGPGAGRFGGTVVGKGTPKQLQKQKRSLTGQYLSGKREIPVPTTRRMESTGAIDTKSPPAASGGTPPGGGWLELLGARQNNLRDVDLKIPLGTFTCITGVSGSGKSSLIEDTLARVIAKRLHRANETPGPFVELRGIEKINKVIVVDQQPLGSTPASNPATYTGVFDHIRDLFTRLPEAKVRGYRPVRFSFNRSGGRCDDCEGNGQRCIEMHFLPDVWVECETCRGKRYNTETLSVRYRGKSIADVLEMSIGEAQTLFENIPKIRRYLATLCAIGLDYLTLGQSAPTLSGGEAQRVKLAAELARPNTGRTLYLLDEPTTGLHFDDIDKLLKVLNSLVELGSTVVVIEHNLDVIKTADWIIDLGPEAGDEGGWIVAAGTPEQIVTHAALWKKQSKGKAHGQRPVGNGRLLRSHTGEMLAPVLASSGRKDRELFDANEAGRKRKDDIDLRHVGRGAKMPWQADGRRWHTVDRVAHNGSACNWEGTALELVIDGLENIDDLGAVNWSERSVVEVAGESGRGGAAGSTWFLHALTGDEWLLTLKFRVRRNTFRQEELRQRFDLKPLDDLDELPVYGRGARVKAKNLKGPWQEVSITVHWLKEIDTPAFAEFLKEACDSYLGQIHKAKLNPADLTPWKVLGRKWHVSRKGFPSNKRVPWDADLLEKLFDTLESALPNADTDYGNKQVVYFRVSNAHSPPIATVHTKRRGGVDLSLYAEAGRYALGRIAGFGSDREITSDKNGNEIVKIRFDNAAQVKNAEFRKFLKQHAKQ